MDQTNTTKSPLLPIQFMDLKPKEFKNLYYLYLDLLAAGQTPQNISHALSERMGAAYGFPSSVSSKIAKTIYQQFSDPSFATRFIDLYNVRKSCTIFAKPATEDDDEAPMRKLFLSTIDVERYKKFISVDDKASVPLKRLLIALMSVYRRNYHHSGWVKYDKKLIFYLAGLQDLPARDSEELTQYLHQEYGFSMRVVGSNSPTPCFKIDWLFDQPQPGSHINAYLDYGILSPETITAIVCDSVQPKKID